MWQWSHIINIYRRQLTGAMINHTHQHRNQLAPCKFFSLFLIHFFTINSFRCIPLDAIG